MKRGYDGIIIGENIRRIRRVRNMTQGDVAGMTGLTCAIVSRMEAGKYSHAMRRETVDKLCDALGCTFEELTGQEPLTDAEIERLEVERRKVRLLSAIRDDIDRILFRLEKL